MQSVRAAIFALVILVSVASSALAVDEQPDSSRRVLFVLVFDKTCHAWCDKVRPVVKDLQAEYGDKVNFAELDSTQNVLKESERKAKELGVLKVFSDVTDYVPIVLIFDGKKKLVKELPGPKPVSEYKSNIEKAMARSAEG